jgi:hypothetical protein
MIKKQGDILQSSIGTDDLQLSKPVIYHVTLCEVLWYYALAKKSIFDKKIQKAKFQEMIDFGV